MSRTTREMKASLALLALTFALSIPEYGFGQTYSDLQDVANNCRMNRESIVNWFGVAKITEQRRGNVIEVNVEFGVDNAFDIDFFCSKLDPEGVTTWGAGQFRKGSKYWRYSAEPSEIVVTKSSRSIDNRRLNSATFDPLAAFFVLGDQHLEDVAARFQEAKKQGHAVGSISIKNDLITLRYKAANSKIEPTELTFDLASGGNLVKKVNPTPKSRFVTDLEWEQIDGIWLPSKVERTQFGIEDAKVVTSKLITFDNRKLNEKRVEKPHELNFKEVFGLDSVSFTLLDQFDGTVDESEKSKDEEQKSGESQSGNWLLNSIIVSSLVSFAVFVLISVGKRSRSWDSKRRSIVYLNAFAFGPIILTSALFFLLGVPDGVADADADSVASQVEFLCGHHCAKKALRLFGVNTIDEELATRMRMREAGNSMLEVMRLLQSYGLKVESKVKNTDLITKSDLPAIAHLRSPNHYVLVLGQAEVENHNEWYVLDGVKKRRELSLSEFRRRFSGNLLSVKGREDNSSTNISFDALAVDFGALTESKRLTQTFRFRNLKDTEIELQRIHTNCDCVASEFSKKGIPPLGEGEIELTFSPTKTAKYNGEFEHVAVVQFSDESELLPVSLSVSGRLSAKFYTPTTTVDFGDISVGDQLIAMVPIQFESILDFERLPSIRASVNGEFSDTKISWRWRKDIGSRELKVASIELKLTQRDVDSLSQVHGQLEVFTTEGNGQRLIVPFVANTVPAVQMFPPILSNSKKLVMVSRRKFSFDEKELESRLASDRGIEISSYGNGSWVELDFGSEVILPPKELNIVCKWEDGRDFELAIPTEH